MIDYEKLKEQATPKPKYQLGKIVWINWLDEPRELVVSGIDFMKCVDGTKSIIYFDDTLGHMPENKIYPTKESLIEFQINYWISLKNQEKSTENKEMSIISDFSGSIKELKTTINDLPINTDLVSNHSADELEKVCDHINDGMIHMVKDGDFKAKCTKCGEFYR